jgi:hypothetical protein
MDKSTRQVLPLNLRNERGYGLMYILEEFNGGTGAHLDNGDGGLRRKAGGGRKNIRLELHRSK